VLTGTAVPDQALDNPRKREKRGTAPRVVRDKKIWVKKNRQGTPGHYTKPRREPWGTLEEEATFGRFAELRILKGDIGLCP